MDQALDYAPVGGDRHRHGGTIHSHPHGGRHAHEEGHSHAEHSHHHGEHGHTHGLVDPSIKRSRAGVRAVVLSFLVLGLTAAGQVAIFASAAVAGIEAILRLIHPEEVTHLAALLGAGLLGFAGNWIAALIRLAAGRSLDSPALIADGNHAKADAYVSLAVIASALAVSFGLRLADPLIGLGISVLIMRITWQSWRTVRDGHVHSHSH